LLCIQEDGILGIQLNLLDQLDGELGGGKVVGQGVLVHVQGGQSEGQFRLQLWGESLLVNIVAAL